MTLLTKIIGVTCKVAGCVVTLASGRATKIALKTAIGLAVAGYSCVAARKWRNRIQNIRGALTDEAFNSGLPRHFRIKSHSTEDYWVEEDGSKPLEVKVDETTYITYSECYRNWCDELLLEFPVVRADDGSYATMAAFLREKLAEAGWRKRNMADFIPRVIACTYLDTRRTLTRRELDRRDPGRFLEWITGARPHPRWRN